MLVFRCECDEVLSAEPAKAGKLGECPDCGKILRIPEKIFEFTKLTLKRADGTIKVPRPPTTSVKLGDPKKFESKPAPASVSPPPPTSKEAVKAPAKESVKAEPKAPPPPPAPPPAKEAGKAEAKPSAPKEPVKAEAHPSAPEKAGKKSAAIALPMVPPPPPSPSPRSPMATSAAEEAAEEDEELKRVVQRTPPRERRLDGKPFTNVKGSSGLPMKIFLALGGIGVLAGIAYFAGLFGGKTEADVPKRQPPAPVEKKAVTPAAAPASNDKVDTPKTDAQ